MINLYCIPGLGADQRLFRNLNPSGYQLKFMHWVKPDAQDTLETYADKLIPQIDQKQPFALLGVSIGGIVATILSTKINPIQVFVISSIKSSSEAPKIFKVLKAVRVKYILSSWLLKHMKPVLECFFGKMSKLDKNLFFKMIDEADDDFLPWAAGAILEWKSKDELIPFEKIVQIIGDKDLVFRYSNIKNGIVINGGSHMMILNKTREINKLIEENSFQYS
jgi:esterase/lipase